MWWKLVRLQPSCDACLLSDDFEGETNGSEIFPNSVIGAERTVKLRIRPFLGKANDQLGNTLPVTFVYVGQMPSISSLFRVFPCSSKVAKM